MDNTVNNIEDKTITGKAYHTDAVRVIGKTGTADYTDKNGKYIADSVHVIRSFAGIFPKDNPEYIIYVAVKDFTGTTAQMGGIVKNLIESVAKYRNLDTRETDKDESKIVTLPNLTNKTVTSAEADLANLGIQYVVIGDGNKVVSQYPKKDNKVSQKSKVFLKTNYKTITMPDITGWSSAEVVDFCNIVGLQYNLDGYGYVNTSSIPAGTELNEESVLTVTLQSISPQSLLTEEVKEDGKQEGN
jgi:penicillin-binding protein 2B